MHGIVVIVDASLSGEFVSIRSATKTVEIEAKHKSTFTSRGFNLTRRNEISRSVLA